MTNTEYDNEVSFKLLVKHCSQITITITITIKLEIEADIVFTVKGYTISRVKKRNSHF